MTGLCRSLLSPFLPRTRTARRSFRKAFAAGVLGAAALSSAAATPASAEFGFSELGVTFTNPDGSPASQAGSHPFAATTSFLGNIRDTPGGRVPDGEFRDVVVELPPGFVGSATAVPQCSPADFVIVDHDHPFSACPDASAVGIANVAISNGPFTGAGAVPFEQAPVFMLSPDRGKVAKLGFVVLGVPVVVDAGLSPDPPYKVQASGTNISQTVLVFGARVTLWGNPADPAHDAERGSCLGAGGDSCPAGIPERAFLTLPRSCQGSLTTAFSARSWQSPATWVGGSATTAPGMSGCAGLAFSPLVSAQPSTTQQASPAGLTFGIDIDDPGLTSPDGTAHSDLEKAVVTLPEGMTANPSAADGLGACSPAQLAAETAGSDPGAGCPNASKVASLTIDTPLLAEQLDGSIFLATPHDNPFNTLLAGYLVAKLPERGIVVKIPGKIDADPVTGRLTASFDENPQLPFSHLTVEFPAGPRASLATPRSCGPLAISSQLSGWSGASVTRTSAFDISGDGSGGACAAARFNPSLEAGVTDPAAGSSSPFVLRVQRADLDNELKTVTSALPPGLLAKLAGIPRCTDAEAAAGACPEASRVGRVEAGAGVGPAPFYITAGKAFLTDGYKGAPFGLLVSVPAVAGPFDLGVVNVRAALHVDPVTAQVTAVADPAPRILEGIPLQVRDVRVIVDRAGFMRAPTSCDEMAVAAAIGSWADDTATPSSRFQVGGCAALPFKPGFRLRLTGASQTRDGGHPGVVATATQRPGEAGIKQVKVALPLSLALDPNNAQALCEYEDGLRLACPASSIIGHAEAVTPLLNEPLTGPVYFVKNVRISPRTGRPIRTLPTLLVTLTGENGLKINLRASSDVDKRARLVSSFSNLPDAPVSSFKLTLKGGRDGILVVTHRKNLCRGRHVALAQTDGHNGKAHDPRIRLATPCVKAGKPRLRRGKLRLPVRVPRAGTLRAGGGKSGLTKTTRRLAKAGKTTLTLKPTRKARRTLARRGRMRLRIPIRFTPRGTKQAQRTTSRPITLRR